MKTKILSSEQLENCPIRSLESRHYRNDGTCRCPVMVPERRTWFRIQGRCHNPNHDQYPSYGAKGIKVCDRWRNSFKDFLADVGMRPSDTAVLIRIKSDKDYEPGNVEWGTRVDANRRRSGRTIVGGVTLAEAAERTGLRPDTIMTRLKGGMTENDALSAKVGSLTKGRVMAR